MKMRIAAYLGMIAMAVGTIPLAATVSQGTLRSEAPHTISLDPYIGQLRTVNVLINGQPARLLLDTGGGMTMLSPELAEAVGCGPHGALIGFRMTGERVNVQKCGAVDVQLGGYVRRIEPGVFDLMALLPAGLPPVDGVVSLDLFDDEIVTIDLGAETLVIAAEQPASDEAQEGAMRIMREMGGRGLTVFVQASAQIGNLYLLLDSANLDTIILSPSALEQMGMPASDGTTSFPAPIHLVGLPISSREARMRDIIYDGALNSATIEQYRITLDLAQERIWYLPTAE